MSLCNRIDLPRIPFCAVTLLRAHRSAKLRCNKLFCFTVKVSSYRDSESKTGFPISRRLLLLDVGNWRRQDLGRYGIQGSMQRRLHSFKLKIPRGVQVNCASRNSPKFSYSLTHCWATLPPTSLHVSCTIMHPQTNYQ
jgi:hypothetical protein